MTTTEARVGTVPFHINGGWEKRMECAMHPVTNPAIGARIAEVPQASPGLLRVGDIAIVVNAEVANLSARRLKSGAPYAGNDFGDPRQRHGAVGTSRPSTV
jgi:hypothetical protein